MTNNLISIASLKDSISMQMEIEFTYNKKAYLLEPIYDKSGIYAIAWLLSTNNGKCSRRINETDPDKIINVAFFGHSLRKIWPKVIVEMM